MKRTLAVCAITLLTSCGRQEPEFNLARIKVLEPSGDSPIVVSDGSTHFRHRGSAKDLVLSGNGNSVTATVTSVTTPTLSCSKLVNCPQDPTDPHPNTTPPYSLNNWRLVLYDSADFPIMTIQPGAVANTIDAIFSSPSVEAREDTTGDSHVAAGSGTEISLGTLAAADGTPGTNTFRTASLYNNGAANPITLTCNSNPPTTHCKLRIDYK